jgi:aryl-alcohol dehydrogenase-like predicted oxidoreductase
MKYRKLGKTDVSVSEISLGCWTLGGLNWVNGQPNGWADVDEKEAAGAVDLALERGVNHFDNADVYGNGRAERMLARILGNRTRKVVVATKVGWFPGTAEHAYEPAHIRHQCEQSLINLKRDFIDLYYLHHGDFGKDARYLEGAACVMHDLKKEGKVRLIGQSAYSDDDFERAVPVVRPDVLQSWANASDTRFVREGSRTRALMDARGATFVAFSPLAQGLLLGKYRSSSPPQFAEGDHRRGSSQFTVGNIARMEGMVGRLKERFGGDGKDLARVALQYLLSFPCVSCVIPGFRDRRQVEVNLDGADRPLTPEDQAFVRQVFGS